MADADFLVGKVSSALTAAEKHESRLTPEVLAIPGYTSPGIRHFLNNLCDFPGCRFLEVGTLLGATVAAASFRAPGYFVTIDNFSEQYSKIDVRHQLAVHLRRLSHDCCIAFHEDDCWRVADELPANAFNLYLYDGCHREREQQDAIVKFWRVLRDRFVLIIDDWNEPLVRAGTEAGLSRVGHTIVQDWSLRTSKNGCIETWWNGLYVAVVEKGL